jgi:type II secretory pathway pseudopilin PulG
MNLTRSASSPLSSRSGLTLVEAVLALAIAALTISGVATGYVFAAQQMEQAACSAAAESLALQRLEQARAAKWDALANPPVDELITSNFPVVIAALDLPVPRDQAHYATNTTTITTVSEDPPLKRIRVDCVWSFLSRGPFTNTVTLCRASDQ